MCVCVCKYGREEWIFDSLGFESVSSIYICVYTRIHVLYICIYVSERNYIPTLLSSMKYLMYNGGAKK